MCSLALLCAYSGVKNWVAASKVEMRTYTHSEHGYYQTVLISCQEERQVNIQ